MLAVERLSVILPELIGKAEDSKEMKPLMPGISMLAAALLLKLHNGHLPLFGKLGPPTPMTLSC